MSEAAAVPEDLEAVRSELLEWFEREQRSFPWRETDDPYAILVCEVMSQQTQLSRVVEPWEAFLDRWPNPGALADAEQAEVVGFWSSHQLGYNNRARYLHEAAILLVEEFDGAVPESPETLEELPGVGPYTATAVASIAFGQAAAVVDTNVKRVLYRAFDVADEAEQFETVANALIPAEDPRDWNEAMMELGGTICEKSPQCDGAPCPWRHRCHAYSTWDFTAPDVPSQPPFDGSHRQYRGRVIRVLESADELALSELGPRIRVDYTSEGDHGRTWLRELLADLTDDGLVELDERGDEVVVRLAR